MLDITYSKKQINPLVEKYQIDVEKNVTFQSIIKMFQDATNYQIWAIKAVFENALNLPTLEQIRQWIEANPSDIKNLIKGNIVSYKSASDISLLIDEMNGLDAIRKVRAAINKFNTRQREMLTAEILAPIRNGLDVRTSSKFRAWAPILTAMETLVKHRKDKLISTSSAIDNLPFLMEHIQTALNATYDWNREDMLSFMERNANDCKVVYDKDNIVVLDVPSFKSSKILCGNGRTGWCLTREERYFNQYAKDASTTHQYFVFNFNRPEDDELAHIGFTVRKGNGICYAHSTTNVNMLDGVNVKGKRVTIHDALRMFNIGKSVFMPLGKLKNFKWTVDSIIEWISKNPADLALSYNENGRLVVRALSPRGVQMLIDHTMVDHRQLMQSPDKVKVYVMLDLNLPETDDNSVITLQYVKDQYQIDTLSRVLDAYNGNLKDTPYLSKLGITSDKYLDREAVQPTILLHKLIDERQEEEAIRLIATEGDEFDVNFEFNQRTPIFSVISAKMYKLFKSIVQHKKFNCSTSDAFGESLLQSLLYSYLSPSNQSEKDAIKRMINIILESNNFDYNVQNINLDTAVNIACEHKELLWVAEVLIANPHVNLNVVNDLNCTALGCALQNRNIEALKLLGKRVDLVVREEDVELAKENGIDLNQYIDPRPIGTLETSQESIELARIFNEWFRSRR